MANELKISVSTVSTKNGFNEGGTNTFSVNQTGKGNASFNQVLSTSAEALTVGETLAPFWIKVVNLDATASVTVGTDSTAIAKPLGQIPAGVGVAILTHVPVGATVYAVASAGTPTIHVEIFPD